MVNIDDFVKRLEIILDYFGLNASSFADKIGVQRSSMSHLLSGRNKPSLDFVMKILDVFPEVDLYWILIGKGNFPKSENETLQFGSKADLKNEDSLASSNENYPGVDLFSQLQYEEEKPIIKNLAEPKKSNLSFEEDEIEKIVFFYKNGTFKAYVP
ncbi:transcriptional regulator with XRE-family HTH domain [Flavobacterium sp. HSC-32F16]|uniref:helix-turn-helix domain-containing protein n=1 Tax=Flavobacterium sp. HSC-32F16 TaxID=2910964 RepID=UPI0020A5D7A5|nr:helix-turn-helix transcriptional regulator [Flavobacterium sp. HSC-32F16]MCP2024929.1 transcriptional regulator with XRE-family HTH domain [Flavobacterium sp. HSC-32F16]